MKRMGSLSKLIYKKFLQSKQSELYPDKRIAIVKASISGRFATINLDVTHLSGSN